MRTLVFADIHANAPALEAVLREVREGDRIVFLGDLCNFGGFPRECVQLLAAYEPVCVMGNHDADILRDKPVKPWNQWARTQLSADQLAWIAAFPTTAVLDGHILLVHGAYPESINFDLVDNALDEDIERAFAPWMTPAIDQVWFGHYHYQIDRVIGGVEYHCIRPVGQHRDKDPDTGYAIYENGVLTQTRIPYDLEKAVQGIAQLPLQAIESESTREKFIAFMRAAHHDGFLHTDIHQRAVNDARRKAAQ